MLDPRLITLFGIIFIGLGAFNIVMGRRRILQARAQGQTTTWYKQIAILTGIEYILLAGAFLVSISISYHWFPTNFNWLIVPLYIVILLASGALASYVIYQGIVNSRRAKGSRATRESQKVVVNIVPAMTAEQRAEHIQKRRERRQKSAVARRRKAGKA